MLLYILDWPYPNYRSRLHESCFCHSTQLIVMIDFIKITSRNFFSHWLGYFRFPSYPTITSNVHNVSLFNWYTNRSLLSITDLFTPRFFFILSFNMRFQYSLSNMVMSSIRFGELSFSLHWYCQSYKIIPVTLQFLVKTRYKCVKMIWSTRLVNKQTGRWCYAAGAQHRVVHHPSGQHGK